MEDGRILRNSIARHKALIWKEALLEEYAFCMIEGLNFVEVISHFLDSNPNLKNYTINENPRDIEISLLTEYGRFNFTFRKYEEKPKVEWKEEGF